MAIRKQPRPAWIDRMHHRRAQREYRRLQREYLEALYSGANRSMRSDRHFDLHLERR